MLAQLVEHVTFNDVADGSNPSQDTIFLLFAPQIKVHVPYVRFTLNFGTTNQKTTTKSGPVV